MERWPPAQDGRDGTGLRLEELAPKERHEVYGMLKVRAAIRMDSTMR